METWKFEIIDLKSNHLEPRSKNPVFGFYVHDVELCEIEMNLKWYHLYHHHHHHHLKAFSCNMGVAMENIINVENFP